MLIYARAELWCQAVLEAKPEWAGLIALHHGSLTAQARLWVEQALRSGDLRCIVCTSGMDLGVDYSPVELSIQIGSPKNIARLVQRAGRSGDQPHPVSKIICVPINALKLIEIAAVRAAIQQNDLEQSVLPIKPLDVLVQHIISMSLGDRFDEAALFDEIKCTYSITH